MNRKTIALMLGCLSAGVLIGLGIAFFVLFTSGRGAPVLVGERSSLPSKGMPLADFELKDLDGNAVKLSQFKGHPVLVNFWASWCAPCKEEMPLLQYSRETYADLVVVGVNEQEPLSVVKDYISENNLSFLFLLDENGEIGGDFHVRALPTTFFLDANGVLQAQHIGSLNAQQLNGYLTKIGVSP